MRKGTKHNEETRKKMQLSASKRIMPPQTEAHKRKLSESNKKTWAKPEMRELIKKIGAKSWEGITPQKKAKRIKKLKESLRKINHADRARETMIQLRKDPEWMRKSVEARKGSFTGTKNPFYGKKHKVATRKKISKTKINSETTPRGKGVKSYIDGKGSERHGERITFMQGLEYCLFRESVFKRDNWTCQKYGTTGRIQAHHLQNYHKYPELRTVIKNGITLSKKAHKEFHKIYGNRNNTKEQMEEFLGKSR